MSTITQRPHAAAAQSRSGGAAMSLQWDSPEAHSMTTRAKWQRIAGLAVASVLSAAAMSHAQFRPFSDRTHAMLEGNWQSCREPDGRYGERVYDGKWTGVAPFELHMGPYHEFALFRGIQDAHREHASSENLLRPFTVELRGRAARQAWDIDGLHFEVVLAGGSREECESWFVTLKPSGAAVSH